MSKLPPLPNPAYGWYEDYYDGWSYVENPSDRWAEMNLFTEDQLRSYGKACWEAAIEAAAKACDQIAADEEDSSPHKNYDLVAYNCASAIRSMKEPQ